MLNLATKILTSSPNKTHIFSLGQAGFIIKSASGQLLAIDLYLSECVERLEKSDGFNRLLPKILNPSDIEFDVIICTHAHYDHFDVDSVPLMLANKNTKLLCSYGCKTLVDSLLLDYYNSQATYVKSGDCIKIGDFDITFVSCDHGTAAPDAVGVVVKVDGKIIYEVGDSCLRLDNISEIPQPLDVLIAPINGMYGNMNEEECSILADKLGAKVTIPCHYGMFASHKGNVGIFYDIMKQKNLHTVIMPFGGQYTL